MAHVLVGEPASTSPEHALQRHELLALHRLAQAVERLVDAAPARQLLHRVEPAPHVRVGRVVDADQLADRDDAGAEVVGDGELVAAKIRIFRPDPMLVEDLQPALGVLLAEVEGGSLRLVTAPFEMREELRIAQILAHSR